MLRDVGVHRMDEADVIHTAADVGEDVADPLAGLPVLLEGKRGGHETVLGVSERLAIDGIRALARVFRKQGLVVESIHLRRTAWHEELDDALGPWRKVRGLGEQWSRSGRRTESARMVEQSRQADHAHSCAEVAEEIPARMEPGGATEGGFVLRELHGCYWS